MKFTKGLFLGAALGMSAAMMMNNNTRSNFLNRKTTDITANTQNQTNDYIQNDII